MFAYKRKIETIATSKIDAERIAAAPLIEPFVASIDGSYCNVTNEKYRAALKINAKTYR
jgi:hypothetical protein